MGGGLLQGLHLHVMFFARFLLVVAAAMAGWLWYSSSTGGVAGCGEGSGCDTVLSSVWSQAFGVSVAAGGLMLYLVTLVCSRAVAARAGGALEWVGAAGCTAIFFAAIWFTLIQVSLQSFCPWCCATHVTALGAVFLLGLSRSKAVTTSPLARTAPGLAGLASVVALAGASYFGPAPQYHAESSAVRGASMVGADGALRLFEGKVTLQPRDWPSLGANSSAPLSAVLLMDYTCKYCRAYHPRLLAALGDKERVLVLPVTVEKREESRPVQELMLTLFLARPELWPAFTDRIMNGEIAPTAVAVNQALQSVLTLEGLKRAVSDHAATVRTLLVTAQDAHRLFMGDKKTEQIPALLKGDYTLRGYEPDVTRIVTFLKSGDVPAIPLASKIAHLEFLQPTISLPPAKAGYKHTFTAHFTNKGRDTLTISWIDTKDGGIPRRKPSEGVISGEKDYFEFAFISPYTLGPYSRTITIHTNGGPAALTVSGDVDAPE